MADDDPTTARMTEPPMKRLQTSIFLPGLLAAWLALVLLSTLAVLGYCWARDCFG